MQIETHDTAPDDLHRDSLERQIDRSRVGVGIGPGQTGAEARDASRPIHSPRDLLANYDRPVRRELFSWARETTAELTVIRPPTSCDELPVVAPLLNRAALIEAYSGQCDIAGLICHLFLGLVSRLRKRHGAEVGGFGIQPWVNLGRLCVIKGEAKAARAHFSIFEDYTAGRKARLGELIISSTDWPLLEARDPQVVRLMETVRVVDNIKSFLAAEDYVALLAFLPSLNWSSQSLAPFIREAEIIALTAVGREQEVADRIAEAHFDDPYCTATLWARSIESWVLLGDRRRAERTAVVLAALEGSRHFDHIPATTRIRFLDSLANQCEVIGRIDLAYALSSWNEITYSVCDVTV